MAWIESHQALERHPKLLKLISLTGWSINEAIGVLHRLWWWTLAYAEDGDLSKYGPSTVAPGLDLRLTTVFDSHEKLFDVLMESGFMEKNMFIHDWMEYAGRYLKTKYKTHHPEKLADIKEKYEKKRSAPRGKPRVSPRAANLPTNLTNLPTPPLPEHLKTEIFCSTWIDFCLNRVEMKKPVTERAAKILTQDLSEHDHDTAVKMLRQSIKNNWQGVFALNAKVTKKEEHVVNNGPDMFGGYDKK